MNKIVLLLVLFVSAHANAAINCSTVMGITKCFDTQTGRSSTTMHYGGGSSTTFINEPIKTHDQRQTERRTPEQNFGECTLALGCIKQRSGRVSDILDF